MILEINGLSCGYGTEDILHDINFTVSKGDIVSIIGPNGSGKTTLFRALTRILKPSAGKIFFQGKDLGHMTYREMAKKIAVVSQEIESAWLTVEEYIMMGRIPYFERYQFFETSDDISITERYMKMTGVDHLRKKSMSEISGGERQLVAITKALTQEPELLLLDEPTSHLDITHQVGILDLVKKLNSEYGITVIMIVHDLNLASEYCNKLIMISSGSVYNQGTPQDVITYEALEEVYNTVVIVEKNPLSDKPYVLLVSEEDRKRFL
ncbi:MAG: ABC transporter ATP-binding protein [Spirochaetes bacterium]|nr:ABC transporter ATP-binding protein [Spirochaetota bacterium]